MRLFKFLKSDRKSPYSGYEYPPPGAWTSEIHGAPVKYRRGYHLARPRDLSQWIDTELWVAEIREPARSVECHDCVLTTSSIRLVELIDEWDLETMAIFTRDCVERARFAVNHINHAIHRGNVSKAAFAATAAAAAKDAAACVKAAINAVSDLNAAAYAEAARDVVVACANAAAANAYTDADGKPPAAYHAAYVAEQRWQSRKICELLDLEWED